MKAIILLHLLCFSLVAKCQDFSSIDAKALHIPAANAASISTLAKYIDLNFQTPLAKLRAIHIWTAANIKYDTDSMYVFNAGADPELKFTAAFRRRKGVCQNYAAIFNELANRVGLAAYVVDGYTRQGGRIDRTGHSWCAVNINDQWFFCDPTWDKDRPLESRYFFVSPEDLILSHIPFDPVWQLTNQPITHHQFYNGMKSGDTKRVYNFQDSIKAYLQLPALQQLEASAKRIQQSGLENELIKNDVAFLKMNAEIIKQNNDEEMYDAAVADVNSATKILNLFIAYRNNFFTPYTSDQNLGTYFNEAMLALKNADKKLESISQTTAVLKPNTEVIKERISKLSARVIDQQNFIKKYLSTEAAKRALLFYQ